MFASEKIAKLYLRLNGFFVMEKFTVFLLKGVREIDLLGFRPGGASEVPYIDTLMSYASLKVDEDFFSVLDESNDVEYSKSQDWGVVAEVKGGERKEKWKVDFSTKIEYARRVFGSTSGIGRRDIVPVRFDRSRGRPKRAGDVIVVPLRHCIDKIRQRISEFPKYKNRDRKEGSWYLSEELLAIFIYLRRLKVFD